MNIFEGLKEYLQSDEERTKTLAKLNAKREQRKLKKQNQAKPKSQIQNPEKQVQIVKNTKIISFLGMIKATNESSMAMYFADEFNLLAIKSAKYVNATQIILEQLKQNDTFTASFYTTEEAYEEQKDLINSYKLNDKIALNYYNKSDYAILYEKILFDINTSQSELIIIDITHGFRDNVFLSILASLMQINIKPKTKIKFIIAKELELGKKYELISLDEYIENMIMSSVLSMFKQSLKVADYHIENKLYDSLCIFSDSLFTNFFLEIKQSYIDFKKESQKLKNSNNFNLTPLLDEILKDFAFIDRWQSNIVDNKQFYDLACLYAKHYYPSNAAQFLVEGLFLYMNEKLYDMFDSAKKEKDINQIASDVLIRVQDCKKTPLDIKNKSEKERKIKQLFNRCKKELEKINIKLDINEKQFIGLLKLRILWDKIKDIRNPMSHCTTENIKFDVNKELQSCLDVYQNYIIKNDVLAK